MDRLFASPLWASGLPFSSSASFFTLCAYYYLQPLGDTLSLSMGLEYTPFVTVGNMLLILILNPVYAHVVRSTRVENVMPLMFRAASGVLLCFGVAFAFFPDCKPLSFLFSVYVGTISLFTTSTLNARLASLHTREEAKRVYGIVAAGSQCGQIVSSLTAPFLFHTFGNLVVALSALMYESAVRLLCLFPTRSFPSRADGEERDEGWRGEGSDRGVATWLGRNFEGLLLLSSTPFLRAVTAHTLLITFMVSGIWYERASEVVAAFSTAEERYSFFADMNGIVGASTILIQTFFFAATLQRFGFQGTLVTEPVVVAAFLSASLFLPGLLPIAILDAVRKVTHYSLVKPAKEGLYASMPKEVVFVAKPLLDTLVYRTGSLLGAAYFSVFTFFELGETRRRVFLVVVSLLWAANSVLLGRTVEGTERENALV